MFLPSFFFFFNNICKQLLANWFKLIFNTEATSYGGSFSGGWKVAADSMFGLCPHVGLEADELPLGCLK